MRLITQKSVQAFRNNVNFSQSNTKVEIVGNETRLYLFDNLIAKRNENGLFVTNAGWKTTTTKERLNGLPNVSIHQKNREWYLNDKKWDGELTKVN